MGKSNILRWDIITIGNLSRNRYWGESDEKAYRSALCTCTLITGTGFRLLVDPSLSDIAEMAAELERRTGCKPEDVTDVFLTHEHGDHHCGLACFPGSQWLAAPPVAAIMNRSRQYPRDVVAQEHSLYRSIDILPTPGHTLSHHSLRFDWAGYSVVIAADAAMTRDFWNERRGYFNSVDFDLAAKTIENLEGVADIVVPGHDNYFLVSR